MKLLGDSNFNDKTTLSEADKLNVALSLKALSPKTSFLEIVENHIFIPLLHISNHFYQFFHPIFQFYLIYF